MTAIETRNAGLLFMKVGLHAGETFEEILERKRREFERTGMIFWGYGGGTCHPTRVVQPFAKLALERGSNIYLVMEEINSHHPPTKLVAKEYSVDGIEWQPIPSGIEVRGSRYALVLDEIQAGDLDLDLSHYEVAAGPSSGKRASEYIGGRVDKACIQAAPVSIPPDKPQIRKVSRLAIVKPPFAVFTR